MNTETRGTLSRRGNISQITNAFVEEVNAFSNTSTGYIIVSYAASPGQQSDNIQMLRLNINRNTVILDSSGQVISLSEIRPQTWINAVFSSAMTRSIPPQANAFLIMVQKRRPQIEIATSIGRIASIDAANGFLYTATKRHQQPGPLRRLKFHLLRSIRPPDHTFIPPPQPARPHYTCNHTDRKHPTSDNSVSCAVIVTESLLWLHNFFKYLPQFHHELRLL